MPAGYLPPSAHTHEPTSFPVRWRPPLWEYPCTDVLDFSNLLVPTMDSTRALFLLRMLHKQRKAVLMVGAEGTAKTSTALMFFSELDPVKTAVKRCASSTPALHLIANCFPACHRSA